MRFREFFLLLLLSGALVAKLAAQAADTTPESGAPSATSEAAGDARLSARDAVILGVVEGVTEFLPVSSTGHLILTNHALGLTDTTPLRDPLSGAPLYLKQPTPEDPAGVPLTRKLAADTFAVVIQAGAILAVVFIYWRQLLGILRGLIWQEREGLMLLRNIVAGFMPAAVVGLAFDDWIDEHLFSVPTVIGALVVGSGIMFAAEAGRRRREARAAQAAAIAGESGLGALDPATQNLLRDRKPSELTITESLVVGAMQCLALWPGMSRSMVTMVGGYFAGLKPARAAEFSFLLGLPTLGGAAVLKSYKAGPAMLDVLGWPAVLLGVGVAAISAALAVKWLVAWLGRRGLGVFAWYRLALAAVLTLGLVQGWVRI